MADKDNIISFADRLRRKKGVGAKSDALTGAEDSEQAQETGDSEQREALPGKLVWLRCPACKTLEYTEVVMAGGRTHNVCGRQVEEVELDIDVRAEYTIAEMNLERLEMLAGAVEIERERFKEYQHRLRLIAGGDIAPYGDTPETLETLPIEGLDPIGLLVSRALRDPVRHFLPVEEEAPGAGRESTEGGAPTEGEEPAEGEAPPEPATDPDPWPPKP